MEKRFRLENLDCANCAAKMEDKISKLDGVESVSINFMTTKMTLEADKEKMPLIIEEAEKIIKKLEPHTKLIKA